MARAETMESVAEAGGGGGGGNGPLPRHNSCRMELPRPFHAWPGLLTSTAVTTAPAGAVHSHHHHHHLLHPLQALYLPCPLPYLRPEEPEETQTRRSSSSPASPPSSTGPGAPGAYAGARTESDGAESQRASSRRGPLPDLLPRNERPSRASPRHRAPAGGEAGLEPEVRRVAMQLRAIGDDMNASILRRAAAPQWQDWREVCRDLLNFITQTLSTLYRLT
ncbi:bcl-2-binding component 3 [Centroberyx affinis]|uniref:bcl-2-binding component 3 n=1 Tax=Centroberyx affinis TaxID=166261 RepID=UPI003A5C255D